MLSEFFLSKRIAENARMRERRVIEANEEDINKKETNAQNINILLTNSLLPQPYTKEIAKHGSNCTICLDDFNSNDKVCVTSCLHVFHYKCLSINATEERDVEVIQVRTVYNNSYQNSFDGTRIQLMQMNRSNLRPTNEIITSS